ncbi:MAG: N-acetylmuramoyl-L-alanine amidase [Nitrospirota bacterium]
MLSRKRELKIRQAIFKGIYEENLRIIGKQPHRISEKKISLFRRTSVVFLVIIFFILGNRDYLTMSFFSEKQVTANPDVQKLPFMPVKTSANILDYSVRPSDYKAFLSGPGIPLSRIFGLGVKTIMLDPGHGGTDSGTIGKMGTKEKDITLDIAKRLRQRLKSYGYYNILLTRDNDVTLPLNRRVELANLSGADLFVSIHLNYLPSKPINIIETYYFGPSSDEKILKLAEQENAGSQFRLSEFKEIIEKIGDTLKLQESGELASSIQKNLFLNSKKLNGDVYNFGIKRAPFVVLLGVDVPSVLAEVSCLSNREEELELNTVSHRENIARYLEAGILDYLNKGEISHEAKRRTEGR